MSTLALIRHGESTFNEQAKFTGWHDVLLTSQGEQQVRDSAEKLKGQHFDIAFCSELTRVKDSLKIILEVINQLSIPTIYTHALNERDYGDLTGKTHAEVIKEFGKDKFDLWHRSWSTPPPHGESLKDTHSRVWKFFKEQILPELKKGKDVLVVASSNSIRGLRKELEGVSAEKIPFLETPTGEALIFEVNSKGAFKKIS